jgi:hypothetical protein
MRMKRDIIRGVFKKRPNFLNSAPTSIENVLWLLSASSVRLWQQSAICPILWWELVIELHLPNWACSQAVRRISDKVTTKELEEQHVCVCVCVKFCCKLGKRFTETFQLLNQAYGEDCMSWTQCYEWFKRFKEGRMSVSGDPRCGWTSTSTNDYHVGRVPAVIRGNHCLTFQKVADKWASA